MGFMQGGSGLVVSGVVLIGVLAGCSPGGDPGPGSTGSGSVTGSPTPSLSPEPSPSSSTLPPAPPELNDLGEVGAIATAKYFLSLYPYVYNTGDLTTWNELSLPDCTFCSGVKENVADLHTQGGYRTGGEIAFHDESVSMDEAKLIAEVSLASTTSTSMHMASPSSTPTTSAELRDSLHVYLAATEKGWRIFDVAVEAQ